MIDAKRTKDMIRWKERDTDEVRFSDYEIYYAINEVLRYLTVHLSNMQSDVLERERIYKVSDFIGGAAKLPDDFTSIKGVYRLSDCYRLHAVSDECVPPDTFRIFAGRIYAEGGIRFCYYGKLLPVKDGAQIDLPDAFFDVIVKLSRMVLNHTDVDAMTEAMRVEVDSIVPRRKYNHVRVKMPFYV